MNATDQDPVAPQLDRLINTLEWIETLDDELVVVALASCVGIARDRTERLRCAGVQWNPWAELMQRMTTDLPVRLVWADLSNSGAGRGAVVSGLDDEPGYVICLQEDLDHSEWAEVLTHELCHIRRGVLYTGDTPADVVDAEEAVVRAMAAELLDEMAGAER